MQFANFMKFCKSNKNLSFQKCSSLRKLSLSMKKATQTQYTAKLAPELEDKFQSGEIKHRKHPGIRKLPCISLPEKLNESVSRVLSFHEDKPLKSDSLKFTNQLYSRRLPIEYGEVQTKAAEILQKMNVDIEDSITVDDLTKEQLNQVKQKLKSEVNRWKPINYTDYTCLLYLVSRLSANYACIHTVFSEIVKLVPNFQPKSLFDFGTGVGTALWAANHLWGNSIKEYFCVDTSSEMNSLCQLILQGGDEEAPMCMEKVYFRQFLPGSQRFKYDLVVSAFSMMELPSGKERIRVIDTLWNKTNDLLIIIENGSNAGFSTVLDARDYILKLEADSPVGVDVIAPCPHKMVCPKFGDKMPCHFPVNYYPFFPYEDVASAKKDLFSYVVLKKGHVTQENEAWPRIIKQIKVKSKVAHCAMCCSDGQLHEIVFTRKRHGRHVYRCARNSTQGDVLPVTVIPMTERDDETVCEESEDTNEEENDDEIVCEESEDTNEEESDNRK